MKLNGATRCDWSVVEVVPSLYRSTFPMAANQEHFNPAQQTLNFVFGFKKIAFNQNSDDRQYRNSERAAQEFFFLFSWQEQLCYFLPSSRGCCTQCVSEWNHNKDGSNAAVYSVTRTLTTPRVRVKVTTRAPLMTHSTSSTSQWITERKYVYLLRLQDCVAVGMENVCFCFYQYNWYFATTPIMNGATRNCVLGHIARESAQTRLSRTGIID